MANMFTGRNKPSGSFTPRDEVSSSFDSRKDVKYLMTQLLDFLMTEDNRHIVLQDSYTNDAIWTPRTTI